MWLTTDLESVYNETFLLVGAVVWEEDVGDAEALRIVCSMEGFGGA